MKVSEVRAGDCVVDWFNDGHFVVLEVSEGEWSRKWIGLGGVVRRYYSEWEVEVHARDSECASYGRTLED